METQWLFCKSNSALLAASDEESEAEVEEQEEEESDDEFCDRTVAPVPKWWEVLAGNRAVYDVQLCQQLRLEQGSSG